MDQPPLPPSEFGKDHRSNHHHTMLMIKHMPDSPQRNPSHHRRALSDSSFRFNDLLLLSPSDLDLPPSDLDLPPSHTHTHPHPTSTMYIDDPLTVDAAAAAASKGGQGHFMSFSVDSDFLDGLGLGLEGSAGGSGRHRKGHRHSASMDGLELEGVVVKRAMGVDRLAELALFDPKRAKRILANRQSAALSKERKIKYTRELERKVQKLQTEATTLSAQVTLLQRDTTGLTARNKELKMRLQAMEQQAQLQDALNEALREEVQHLKIAAHEIPASKGNYLARRYHSIPAQPQPQFGNNSPQSAADGEITSMF